MAKQVTVVSYVNDQVKSKHPSQLAAWKEIPEVLFLGPKIRVRSDIVS
jgi:hypothetical protein